MADTLGNVGIMPLPGTPAYEAALRNLLNAQPGQGTAGLGDQQSQAIQAYNTLVNNTGESFGIAQPAVNKLSGGTSGSSGSGFSNQATGAGLLDEILGLIRGTGEKQFGTARSRLTEDYGQAREQKMRDLARRGLFRAGVGETELQNEIEKPYSRGMADLESNMADANTDLGLRKAGILADIEGRARQQAAQTMMNASMTGTGRTYPFGKTGADGGATGSMSGDGGMFGATFGSGGSGGSTRLPAGGGGAAGGGATQTNGMDNYLYSGWEPAAGDLDYNGDSGGDVPYANGGGTNADWGMDQNGNMLGGPAGQYDQYFQGPSSGWGTGYPGSPYSPNMVSGTNESVFGPNMKTANMFMSQPIYGGGSSFGSGYL